MKNFFTFLLISAFLFSSFPQSNKVIFNKTLPGSFSDLSVTANRAALADAMGYYCYADQNGVKQIKSSPDNLLSTIFPGYPIAVSGASFEGGILCNIDGGLGIVYNIGYTVQAWDYNGNVITGWPKNVSLPLVGAPAYGDIDGDGQAEIVVAYGLGGNGFVGAFEKDGSIVSGFPVNNGYIIRSPVLADVDGDGSDEIIVTKTTYPTGQVYIYKGNGTVLSGWPQSMSDIPASSCAVGDITNDGSPEVVAEAYGSIYAWNESGTMLTGFPYMLTGTDKTSYSSPVLADVDNDNIREILFGTHDLGSGVGRLHIIKSDGTELPNFPKVTSYWIYGPPAVGYIDGDNILDVSVGDQILSGSPVDRLYAWNVNGQALSGFPVGSLWAINDQVVIADIDNDAEQELVFDDNAFGEYHAYENNGSPVSGWPIITEGITFFNTPALADVNGDNILDMLGAGITDIGTNPVTHVYLWNLEVPYDPTKITVPVFQYNTKHNGLFVDPSTIPVELVSFTVNVNNNNVTLNWTTSTETNNKGFDVERNDISLTGIWEKVGFVKGNGTSTEAHSYSFIDKNLVYGKYCYRLKQIDFDGSFKYSREVEVNVTASIKFSLEQNYPNPFNPVTNINYQIPAKGFVTLKVFNTLGEEVAALVNEEKSPGRYEIKFYGSNLPSGVYIYRLTVGNFSDSKKLILLK